MAEPKRPFSHPLYGTSFSNLVTLLRQNPGVSPQYWLQIITASASALGRAPIRWLERLLVSRQAHKVEMPDPIFIVGHWRSGTTHLGNILSQSPQFGYVSPIASGLPWELLTLGRLFRKGLERSLPSDRLIDQVPVTPTSPQEDEFGIANMIHFSFLHGLYFPSKFEYNFEKGLFLDHCTEEEIEAWQTAFITYLKKVFAYEGNRQLIIRNPAYTTRIALIKSIFPGAKFIHIYRDPHRIFHSMRNYYRKLFPALAFQDYSHVDIDSFILKIYPRMMDQIISDQKSLPLNEFIEIRYEELEERPIEVLKLIYDQLEINHLTEDSKHFSNYLYSISNYKKNQYQDDPKEKELVFQHWQRFFEHWHYDANLD